VKEEPAEPGPDPWDAQDATLGSAEQTAELQLPNLGGNTAEFAASKRGQEKKNKDKKLAGLTLHQFTVHRYIFKVYKTIDHKQGNYFGPYLKPHRGRYGGIPESTQPFGTEEAKKISIRGKKP